MIDVAIVGGGPAGLTAAMYLRRFHRACLVFDSGESRARWIPESNNCPGFPGGISGVELLRRLRRQAAEAEVPIEEARVDRIARDDDGEGFVVHAGGRHWRARMVMIATGLRDRLPGDWAGEALACGALRLCPICDAFEASDGRIGVFGRGADIGSHARFLRTFSADVTALPLDGADGGEDGATARSDGVQWLGGGRLDFDGERCRFRSGTGAAEFDTVYSFLGFDTSVPIDGLDVERTHGGEILVDRHQLTATPGLYAIGDIVGGLNQISVAVGQAAAAATHAHGQLPRTPRAAPQA